MNTIEEKVKTLQRDVRDIKNRIAREVGQLQTQITGLQNGRVANEKRLDKLEIRIIAGSIRANGGVIRGEGFTAAKIQEGKYYIEYDEPKIGCVVVVTSRTTGVLPRVVKETKDGFEVQGRHYQTVGLQNFTFNFIASSPKKLF